jgi:hypothetical protein
MNVDDLRQTLATMASEVDPSSDANRLQAVDAKVASARRRRVGAGVAVVAVAAVAGLLLPNLVGGSDKAPTATHSQLPTVEDNGVSFYTSPAGDTLLGEKMGQPGDRSVTLRVTTTTTALAYQSVCVQSGPPSGDPVYSVMINGESIADRSCDGTTGPVKPTGTFGLTPSANSHYWAHTLRVVPGQPMTLRAFVTPGTDVRESPPMQLGISLYAKTGPMVQEHGIWLAQQAVSDGHAYKLATTAFKQVNGRTGRQHLDLRSLSKPLYLVYGVASVHQHYRLDADGSGLSSQGGGSALTQVSTPGQKTAHVSIRIRGDKEPGALIYIAAYQQVE